jgi:hypothetical protein
MLKTTNRDVTIISPSDSAFFMRIYENRNAQAAYKLDAVGDFGYSYEKGSDSTLLRTSTGQRTINSKTGDDTKELTFSTSEVLSVESHMLLEYAFRHNLLVEIWEVTASIQAKLSSIKNSVGGYVPAGWMPDKYFVGYVTADSYSNNSGDATRSHEWTLALEDFHDNSWVEPIEWVTGAESYKNASLQPYTTTDNPTHTVRDTDAEEIQYSGDASQTADITPTPDD